LSAPNNLFFQGVIKNSVDQFFQLFFYLSKFFGIVKYGFFQSLYSGVILDIILLICGSIKAIMRWLY